MGIRLENGLETHQCDLNRNCISTTQGEGAWGAWNGVWILGTWYVLTTMVLFLSFVIELGYSKLEMINILSLQLFH
jgi:hypothetical protein